MTRKPTYKDLEQRIRELEEALIKGKQAEESLRESEGRYRALVENASDIVFRTDGSGHFTFINPAALRITGYKEEDIIGRHYLTLIRQDIHEEAMKFFGLQFVKRIPNTYYEYPVIVKDGREIWLGQNTQLIAEGDQVVGFQSVSRDITERKRAELYLNLSGAVLEILNESENFEDSVQCILIVLKRTTGCDAVGIRLQRGDDFPYVAHHGFSSDFLQTEDTLVVRGPDGGICRGPDGSVSLECTCGVVISGKTDPSNPLFTPGGSCWTNDSSPLLDLPASNDPRLHPRNKCIHHGFASVALVPIRTKQRIVGILQLNDRRKGQFSLYAINALEGMASHIGEALLRKQAEEALRESEEQHRLMIENLPLAVLVETFDKIVYVNPAFLTLFKTSTPNEVIGMRLIEFVSPELFDIIKERRQIMTKEKSILPPIELNLRCMDGTFITVVSTPIPIIFQEQPSILSVLYDITERKRSEIELQKANKLLRIHTREIEDLHAELKEQAIRDPLTGLFNRRYLEETMNREFARASREGFPIGFVMIDIDHFKQVNDAHGHKAGDLILQALGNLLLGRIRAEDLVCRYGGEEFLIILTQAGKEITAERAEQWRTDFEALKTAYGEKVLQTTISLGVAVYPGDGVTAEAVIHAADQAMYRAKTLGRNRVVLS
jgi:diguanylate cyclase (GGDEF)-like protein/PAS domain S-box-containing protein